MISSLRIPSRSSHLSNSLGGADVSTSTGVFTTTEFWVISTDTGTATGTATGTYTESDACSDLSDGGGTPELL